MAENDRNRHVRYAELKLSFSFVSIKVHLGCWNSTPEIVDYMTDHGLGREPEDFLKIWAEFHVIAFDRYLVDRSMFQTRDVTVYDRY